MIQLPQIKELLEAQTVTAVREVKEIHYAFSSDLMSDVLRLKDGRLVLLTGLSNVQTIRTAIMADIAVIVLVRGKRASEEMIVIANENDIDILETPMSMFRASGLLFNAGLKPVY